MTDSNTKQETRQQLYDRIRRTSKDEFVLDEMIRLGFWPKNEGTPSIPETIIRQQGELTRELQDLWKKQNRLKNRDLMLREMRKTRLEESRKKQAETKIRKQKEREERAKLWQECKKEDIIYLGDKVSAGLNNKSNNEERLSRNNLPEPDNIKSLSESMNISVGQIRFLAFSRKVSKISHYKRFLIPKKQGGTRLISAPMPRLKNAQYWILDNILEKIPIHKAAHGFISNKSILTNATPHLDKNLVINMDLKDFFPTLTYTRVKGMFLSFGYSEQMATIFGLLCTEPDTEELKLDDERYFLAKSERFLPQGAPTSPAVTNIICRSLDARLSGAAAKHGFCYTRYADDMTFSASESGAKNQTKLLWQVKKIVSDEGFTIHPEKTRIMHKGRRQEVTGIVVNKIPNIRRKTLDRFRTLLFQIEKDGIKGKHWNNSPNLLTAIKGYAGYVAMVNPKKGRVLVERVGRICSANGFPHASENIREEIREVAPQAENKIQNISMKNPWWMFWK